MWLKNRFFKIAFGILLILLILLLIVQLIPVILFGFNVFTTLMYPTIIALILYYLLRPLRNMLERLKIPRYLSLAILFSLLGIVIFISGTTVWPLINQQIIEFSSTPKEKMEAIQEKTVDILNFFNFASISKEQLKENLVYYTKQVFKLITDNLVTTLGSVAKIASFFVITPFLLFYLLKDDYKIMQEFINSVPKKYKNNAKKIGDDIDSALSYYISGQILVAAIVGMLIFIGYSFIGLKYAIILSFFAFIFNLIPFTGPFISTIPALLIGISESPLMGLKVLLVVIIVHLLDVNIISPRIVGQQLNIHPVTVIFLLVVGFSLFGFIGMFIATPLYAVAKILFSDLVEIRKAEKVEED